MKKPVWYMPTNLQNLTQMLAAGLIMDKTGYKGDQYYHDITDYLPHGLILFKNHIPERDMFCAREDRDAIPVILELSLDNIRTEKILQTGDAYCVVQLPLPTSCIKKIIVDGKEGRDFYENQFINYANVPDHGLKPSVNKKLFTCPQDDSCSLPIDEIKSLDPKKPDYEKAQFIGGTLLSLYTLASHSMEFIDYYRQIAGLLTGKDSSIEDSKATYFINCILNNLRPEGSPADSFYYDVLLEILNQKPNFLSGKLLTENIMGYVEDYDTTDPGILGFKNTLKNLADTKLSDAFKSCIGPISRSILLFFMRDTPEELFEFRTQNPKIKLTPDDILFSILLFSARTGYISQSFEAKALKPLADFITSIMSSATSDVCDVQHAKIIEPLIYSFDSKEKFGKNILAACALLIELRLFSYDDFIKRISNAKTIPASVDIKIRKLLK